MAVHKKEHAIFLIIGTSVLIHFLHSIIILLLLENVFILLTG
ncbi:hypothetical protein L21TH_1058 [Caldisalinibacter kiritimatiensis]|uniref:Uncharacterized protein n=1 Tax=Caldisalinibacter kiritimatiensis TaxID=1304284 RepID=R1AW76_9FIRM|nr:hypothetical protein L21TH_1058 [Caldisalinibacter kiritimatiensis]